MTPALVAGALCFAVLFTLVVRGEIAWQRTMRDLEDEIAGLYATKVALEEATHDRP